MSFLIGAMGVLLAFGIVIFIHEFGHFFLAKMFGIKVDRFSFGLGPEAVGFQWGETRYCIAWIPLGGEVRMAGEMETGADNPAPRGPRDFFAKPWYKRSLVVLAGPAMNYVLAFALFSGIAFIWGDQVPNPAPVVGDIVKNYPAEQAGIKPGDRVTSIDGKPVAAWKELAEIIHQSPEKDVTLAVERGGETLSFKLKPVAESTSRVGLIGISPSTLSEKVGFVEAIKRGGIQCWAWSYLTIKYLGEKIVRREKPELSGPLGIASVIAKAAHSSAQDFWTLIALISVGIGLFNVFPIPMLDGGHLAFYVWEGLTKKPVTQKVMQAANAVGLSLLLGILIFATYSDIQRMRGPRAKTAAEAPELKNAPDADNVQPLTDAVKDPKK